MIEVSADLYQHVEECRAVAEAVMDQDIDIETCFGIVLSLGLKDGLNSVISKQDDSILVQAMHLLAEREPKLVYKHVADMVGLGADIQEQERRRKMIGFVRPSQRKH